MNITPRTEKFIRRYVLIWSLIWVAGIAFMYVGLLSFGNAPAMLQPVFSTLEVMFMQPATLFGVQAPSVLTALFNTCLWSMVFTPLWYALEVVQQLNLWKRYNKKHNR